MFVDETGAATNMARRYGRGPRGRRVDGPAPHGHWKSTTFVGGSTSRGLIAPDGAMNGAIFEAWAEQMLAPAPRPGDSVGMDNLAARKVAGVRAAIEARGEEAGPAGAGAPCRAPARPWHAPGPGRAWPRGPHPAPTRA